MNKLLLFILVCTCCTHYWMLGSCTDTLVRDERNLMDMAVSLWCYKSKLSVPLTGLFLYGCYCGAGGSGTPVDEVDQCCLAHDCCYRHARETLQCHSKTSAYQFSCKQSKAECITNTLCGRAACECDRLFAECLTTSKKGEKKYYFYNKKKLCPSPDAACPPVPPSMSQANLEAAIGRKRQTKRKAGRG